MNVLMFWKRNKIEYFIGPGGYQMSNENKFFIIGVSFILSFMVFTTCGLPMTIEWHEITPSNYDVMQPTLESLQTIFIDAFVPVVKTDVYKNDLRVATIPVEQRPLIEKKVNACIAETVRIKWNKKMSKLYVDLQNNRIPIAYVAIAKNSKKEAIGFALFIDEPMKDDLDARLMTVTQGSCDNINLRLSNNDEIHLSLLAVKPTTQQKGVGRGLAFSIFDHCFRIKKIFLTTSASDSNKKTQGFYEHIGFTPVLKGTFLEAAGESDFDKEKILFLYTKP
jgi:ribosomal protein S18 acetylase RimI-like enzyme